MLFRSGDGTNGAFVRDGYFDFDGVNDYIGFNNSVVPSFGSSNFAVECWVKTIDNSSSIFGVVNNYSSSNTNGFYLQLLSTNKVALFGWSSGGSYAQSTLPLNDGKWHHIFCQRVATSTAEIYIDGVFSVSDTTGTNPDTSNDLTIGNIEGYTRYFDGQISNVKIYNKTLTADEVLQNYNSQKGRFE